MNCCQETGHKKIKELKQTNEQTKSSQRMSSDGGTGMPDQSMVCFGSDGVNGLLSIHTVCESSVKTIVIAYVL